MTKLKGNLVGMVVYVFIYMKRFESIKRMNVAKTDIQLISFNGIVIISFVDTRCIDDCASHGWCGP